MRELWPHQQEALDALRQTIGSGIKRICAQAPCGAGKTLMSAAIVDGALKKDKKVAFVVPSISLVDQTLEAFIKEGIPEEYIGIVQADHPLTDWSRPVQICSISTIRRRIFPEADIVIFDEVHILHDTAKKWLAEPRFKDVPFIGLTATPYTSGLGKYFNTKITISTTQELIDKGILSPFRTFATGHPDLTSVKTVAGDYNQGQLSDAMQGGTLTADIVRTWQSLWGKDKTFCFAVDCAHAQQLQKRFIEAGVSAGYQDAYTPRNERQRLKEQFHSGEIRVLTNVGTLTVGVDYDVRCLVLARPTKSEALYCLDSETEILTSHGWKGIGSVNVGDCVPTMCDLGSGEGKWSTVLATYERPMEDYEKWISYEGTRGNIRVTDKHTLLFKSAKKYDWDARDAIDVMNYKGGVFVPTAVSIPQTGVPLTNHELYFIGMMMTDGSWGPVRGTICQSERHPEIIERIEECLRGCGIGYAKRKIDDPPEDATIKQRNIRWEFNFSAGKSKPLSSLGRATKRPWEVIHGHSGFRHLMPWLDKDFASPLMSLSRSQFLVLLQGIHDGDGFKMKSPSIDWTPRSWTLCSARKLFVDRLQALASINGFTAYVREEVGNRKRPIYIVSISPNDWRVIGGSYDGRPVFNVSPATKERVWCIETDVGTIVTRRRGKVTVMGNCQIIGRALRSAPGKDAALILDHSDTTERLGFITDVEARNTDLDSGDPKPKASLQLEKPPKVCPKCAMLRPANVKICPGCGFKAEPLPSDRLEKDGELREITRDGMLIAPKKSSGKELWTLEQKMVFMSELKAFAIEKGRKPGWVFHAYNKKFQEPPMLVTEQVSPAKEAGTYVRSYCKSLDIAYFHSQDYRNKQNAKTLSKRTQGKIVDTSIPASLARRENP